MTKIKESFLNNNWLAFAICFIKNVYTLKTFFKQTLKKIFKKITVLKLYNYAKILDFKKSI